MTLESVPEIKILFDFLLKQTKDLLGKNFIGLYNFGSLSSGDFNPETSDIDFVVVTEKDLGLEFIPTLTKLLDELMLMNPTLTLKLEGSFLPKHVFKDFNQKNTMYPSISVGGIVNLDHKEIEKPIQRYMLRECGYVIEGPAPETFIDQVSSDELKKASTHLLMEWWKPQIDDLHRLYQRDYQAYAVLTMCRLLYTLKTGDITSKPKAANWAKQHLDKKWGSLINRALLFNASDEFSDVNEIKAFIEYTIEQSISWL